MSSPQGLRIRLKQIETTGSTSGQVITSDGSGNLSYTTPSAAGALLGTPTDGSWTNSRYTGGKSPAVTLTATDKVSDAIDSINTVVGLLLPDAPYAFSSADAHWTNFTINGVGSALVASGATDNSGGSMPSAGASVPRITGTLSTNTVTQKGDGSAGTLALWQNGSAVSGESLAFTQNVGDAKSSGSLRVLNDVWGGFATGTSNAAPNGFYQMFDSNITSMALATGFHTVQIKHSVSGNSNLLTVMKDDLTASPTVTSVTVAIDTHTSSYNSGIDHLQSGDKLSIGATFGNLAGQTYSSGTILSFVSSAGSTVNFTTGQAGLSSTLSAEMSPYAMPAQLFTIGGNFQSSTSTVGVRGYNPNGMTAANTPGNLLVLSGTGGVRDAGNTAFATTMGRVLLTNASKNTDTPTALTYSSWDSSQLLNATGYKHEAACVGGVLSKNTTNYSTGYLPVGADYSGKDATQYVTYMVSQAAKSSMTINITGSYSGLWVALPGVSDSSGISPNAKGGCWWDAYALYNGSGVPGRSGDSAAGCASGTAANGSNSPTVTFGTQSSTNSTSNEIMIRVKLTGSQSITALTIS